MDIRDLAKQDIQATETDQEEKEILEGVARILKGIEKGGFKRVFPSVPYSNTRAESPSEIMEKIYLEQLPPEDIKQLMNLDMLSFQLPNIAEQGGEDTAFLRLALATGGVKNANDLRAYYFEEQTRLLEKGKAIYTEKVEKAPETAIKDAAEVVDDLTIIEFVYYRQIVLKEEIKGESKDLKEDGVKMLIKTAQEITSDLFKLWLKATKRRASKETRAEWLEHLSDIIDKKAIEWQLETEEEQNKRRNKPPIVRKPELVSRPTALKVPTSLLFQKLKDINKEFLKTNADGQMFMLVTDFYGGDEKLYHLDVSTKGKVPITSYAAIRSVTGETLPERLRKLTEFDVNVLSAVGTLNLSGNMRITPEQIHEVITGATASTKQSRADNKRLKPQMKQKILLALEKWRARLLYLDFEQEVDQGLIKADKIKNLTKEDKKTIARKHFELAFLSYDLGTYETNRGTEETEIIVHTLPVVYRYSGWKNQIATIKNEVIAAPYKADEDGNKGLYATEDNETITLYLARQIERIKSWERDAETAEKRQATREHRKPDLSKDLLEEKRRTIRLDTLFNECEIDISNAMTKKRKIADIDDNILARWKKEKYIADYQIRAEGQSHNVSKIIIALKKPIETSTKTKKRKK